MKNTIEFYILKFFSIIISRLSLNYARRLAILLAFIFYSFIPIRKKIVRKNLRIAFPDLDEKELKSLTKKAYINLFLILIEILFLPFLKKGEIENLVTIKNSELVDETLKKNKGLIFVSAHFGNWEVMAISAALRLKTTFSIVTKPLRNPFVNEYINSWRTKFGNRIVPLGISIKNIFKELLDKKIIALLADQRAGLNSPELDFFNKKTHVYDGPALLSLKTGAPLIFAIAIRQPNYSYMIELIEMKIPEDLSENQKVIELTKIYIKLLEKYIRAYPDQWFWFHNRWKN